MLNERYLQDLIEQTSEEYFERDRYLEEQKSDSSKLDTNCTREQLDDEIPF
jgi:hypothetical protein